MSFSNKKGFALPTVLIISIIMLSVLVSALASTSAVRVALRDQYYNQLSQQASETGVIYAKACLAKNSGIPQWSDTKPLKPNTDCYGDQIAGYTCSAGSTDPRCSVIVIGNNTVVSFSVPAPLPDSTGAFSKVYASGSVDLLRKSDSTVWRQFSHTSKSVNAIVSVAGTETHWKQISAGNSHTCAIASNDQAYCWGNNFYGQIGDNTSLYDRSAPTAVYTSGALSGLTVKSISSGQYHTCAIASNNKLYCWGLGTSGQIGDNTAVSKSVPTAVYTSGALSGLTIKSIASGYSHTCAVASNDLAYCWGLGTSGQIGDNTAVSKSVPTAVYTSGALSGLTIKSIATFGYHACVIASNNKIYCWGWNGSGQLGDNTTITKSDPVAVDNSGVFSGVTIKSISTGHYHTCGIAANDQAYCWGDNSSGQLGDATPVYKPTPLDVYTSGALSGLTVKSIAGGYYNTCTIASNDQAYCWGLGTSGQIGDNTSISKPYPTAVYTGGALSGLNVKSISAGYYNVCAVASNNQAYCWGSNGNGEFGNNTLIGNDEPTVVFNNGVLSGLTIKSIRNGGSFICVIASNSRAYCSGDNTYGELGDNTNVDKLVPTAVYASGALSGLTVNSISTSQTNVCAIASNSKLYCWGRNNFGQLGDNTAVNKLVPTAVYASGALSGLTIKAVSTGVSHTCAIASNDKVYCWGSNSSGQLGDNTSVSKLVPTAVYVGGALSGLTVKSIFSGYDHTCAIASNNKVYCWGRNNYGQLGDDTYLDKTVPTAVNTSGLLNGLTIKSVTAGYYHTCVVASNDQSYCWGLNYNSQLGNINRVYANKSPLSVKTTSGMPLPGQIFNKYNFIIGY